VKEIARFGHVPSAGTLVQEARVGSVIAQRLFRMRCDCGRSWIELELKRLVKCPACARLNLVRGIRTV